MITFYCANCKLDNESNRCAGCGKPIPAAARRTLFGFDRVPVLDPHSWLMTLAFCAAATLGAVLLTVFLELALSGAPSLAKALPVVLRAALITLVSALCLSILALALQGRENIRFVINQEGIHRQLWLPYPSIIKRAARLTSGGGLFGGADGDPVVQMLEETHLPWPRVARLRFVPSHSRIDVECPKGIRRIRVQLDPETYAVTAEFILYHAKKSKIPVVQGR